MKHCVEIHCAAEAAGQSVIELEGNLGDLSIRIPLCDQHAWVIEPLIKGAIEERQATRAAENERRRDLSRRATYDHNLRLGAFEELDERERQR